MTLEGVFQGTRVLLTGHTGFKGSWLALWLRRLGAEVCGYALPAPAGRSLWSLLELDMRSEAGDVRDFQAVERVVLDFQPEVVFHLAAQSLVRVSYLDPIGTYATNVMGTLHVLEACRRTASARAVVNVTSDKCYKILEGKPGYSEDDAMGGYDPYSSSKGCSELLTSSYRNSYFNAADFGAKHRILLASCRAGNAIGGGDWARDRIVTDLVAALVEDRPIPVRNSRAIRPWQHVLEPLSGYLTLAARMLERPEPRWSSGWNFGPVPGTEISDGELVDSFIEVWGGGRWEDASSPGQPHEASVLRLSIDKAVRELDWHPRWSCREAVGRTARWYRDVLGRGAGARAACEADILAYCASRPPGQGAA